MAHQDPRSHSHSHGAGHSHVPSNVSSRTMATSVTLTLAFVIAEALCGWWGHSLALLSDAGHNLADAGALGFSWYALWIAGKPSHAGMTFGYHRVGIFAALINAVSLVAIALVVGWEAIARIRHPELASGALMIAVASAAIVVNLVIGVWLHAVLILVSSYGVLRESATVLLEGTPAGTDMPEVIAAIKGVIGVLDVHDLHVWMVGPGVVACSCHIVVTEQTIREGQQVLRAVVHAIEHRFHITHTTVQVEVEGCEADDMYCMGQHREQRPTRAPIAP